MSVALCLNGNDVGYGRSDEMRLNPADFDYNPADFDYETLSIQSTLDLKVGDEVWLQIKKRSAEQYIPHLFDETTRHYTHFTGWLLEEDVFRSPYI